MNRSRPAVVLGLVSALLVSGCSDDPVPKVAPSEPPSASVSDSPSGPTEPELPAAATRHTDEGAAGFVRYYIDVLNAAQKSGQVGLLRSISASACEACAGYIDGIADAYGSGGKVVGGVLEIGDLRELPKDYGAEWGAYAKGSATPQTIVNGDGTKRKFPGGTFGLYAYTKWSAGAWQMQWMRTPS